MIDPGQEEAPEPGTLEDDAPVADETTEQAAPQPVIPAEVITAIRDAVAGDIRTLHGELRRQQAELRTMFSQAQTASSRGDSQALLELGNRLEGLATSQDLLAQSLLPEDQQAAFRSQREIATLRRQVETARAAPPPQPAPAVQPAQQAPDPAMQQAALEVAAYAEALDIDVNRLTPSEMDVLRANVPQDDPGVAARAVKANLKKIASARSAAPAGEPVEDQAAATRQQVRQQTTAPTARASGAASSPRRSFKTEAEWRGAHARGEINNEEARAWSAKNLPFN